MTKRQKKETKVSKEKKTELAKKKAAEKMSLIKSPLTPDQSLFILQKTPTNQIYERKGRGGMMFTYVKGGYVKKALNYAFGWLWDFEIKQHGENFKQVWVLGRLVVKNEKGENMIVKEQFGRADIKFLKGKDEPVDFGNDLKAAATDALKKCASELGIASDVYNEIENREVKQQTQPEQPKQNIVCEGCNKPITPQEKAYSVNIYKKALCRECQVDVRNKQAKQKTNA